MGRAAIPFVSTQVRGTVALVDVVEEVPQLCCKPIKKAAASQREGLQIAFGAALGSYRSWRGSGVQSLAWL